MKIFSVDGTTRRKEKRKKNAQYSHDDTDRKMLKKLDILSDHPVGNTIHPKRYKADVTALHFFSVNSLSSFLTLIPSRNPTPSQSHPTSKPSISPFTHPLCALRYQLNVSSTSLKVTHHDSNKNRVRLSPSFP